MSADTVLRVVATYQGKNDPGLWLAMVMAALAREDGTQICVPVAALVKRLQLSRRTIQYRMRQLEKRDWLIKTNAGDGRNGQVTRYRISPQWMTETPSVQDILTDNARYRAACVRKSAAKIGVRPRKRGSANQKKIVAPTGAAAALCAKNEQNSLHPLYTDFSLYKLSEESNKTLAPAKPLAPDWRLPNRFGTWALETFPGWGRELILHFAGKFKAYWVRAGSARDDWFDTWCRFCKQEADYLSRNPQRQPQSLPASCSTVQAVARQLSPHPGETEESYRRRKQAVADVQTVAPGAPPSVVRETDVSRSESAVSRTPELKARIRAELMNALQAAKRGEARLAERLSAAASQTPNDRVSDRPAPVVPRLTDNGAAIAVPQSRAENANEAWSDTSADAPCVIGDSIPLMASKPSAPGCIARRIRPKGGSGYNQGRKASPAVTNRRTPGIHARASPHACRADRHLKFNLKNELSLPLLGKQWGNSSVRLRYLLPDATGQWR